MKGLLARKLGMTQMFDEQGDLRPVTLVQAGPCTVTRVRTPDKDGYSAVQIGFDEIDLQKVTRPVRGQFTKIDLPTAFQHLAEIRDAEGPLAPGEKITVEAFKVGDHVEVIGTSIGKGFAGVVKRHHFNRGDMTHGSKQHRGHGSIGAGTTPGHVLKGTRMSGRMGNERVTQKGLRVLLVDPQRNLLALSGPVPGSTDAVILIRAKGAMKVEVQK